MIPHLANVLAVDPRRHVHAGSVLEPILEVLRDGHPISVERKPAPAATAQSLDQGSVCFITGLEPAQVFAFRALRRLDRDASAPALAALVVGYRTFSVCVLSHRAHGSERTGRIPISGDCQGPGPSGPGLSHLALNFVHEICLNGHSHEIPRGLWAASLRASGL